MVCAVIRLLMDGIGAIEPLPESSSSLHVEVEPYRMVFVFEFDEASKARATVPSPRNPSGNLNTFIRDHIHLEINGQAVSLGSSVLSEGTRGNGVRSTFVRSSDLVVRSIAIAYDVFETLGDRHKVSADFHQQGQRYTTTFTHFEPDYVYETGWSADPYAWRASFAGGMLAAWEIRPLGWLVFAVLGITAILVGESHRRKPLRLALMAAILWTVWTGFRAPMPAPDHDVAWWSGALAGSILLVAFASPAWILLSRIRRA